MKCMLTGILGLFLANGAIGLGRADFPGEPQAFPGDDDALVIQKRGQKKKGAHHHYHGHRLLSRAKLRSLASGTHHISNLHGHKVHAVVHKGRISRLFATDSRGRTVHPRRHHQPRRTAALNDLEFTSPVAQDVTPPDNGGSICFTFSLQTPNGTLTLSICFPAGSVAGGGGGQPDPTPPDPLPGNGCENDQTSGI